MPDVKAKVTVRPVRQGRQSVALVGFGKSRDGVFDLPDDVPVWSLSDAPEYDFPRIDMVFEMHQERDLVTEGKRYQRLRTELPYPVMMLDEYAEYPSSVKYPLDEVREYCFGNLLVGDEPAMYFDSSFPYMLGLAGLLGYKTVHVLGIELRTDTEYRYQRPGAALLIGILAGKGVKVILPKDSALLPQTLYGFDNFQHINRFELLQLHAEIKVKWGEYLAGRESANGDQDKFAFFWKKVCQAEGGMHVLKNLVDMCNDKKIKLNGRDPDEAYAVSRQNLEQVLHSMANQRSDFMGKVNKEHSAWVERKNLKASDELIEEAQQKREDAFYQMYILDGAFHVVNFLIDKMDRAQATFPEFDDPFFEYEDGYKAFS